MWIIKDDGTLKFCENIEINRFTNEFRFHVFYMSRLNIYSIMHLVILSLKWTDLIGKIIEAIILDKIAA